MKTQHTPGLTRDQVFDIADKYGSFQYGDAQGDKRIEFAADVIATYERIRNAAPELLEAAKLVIAWYEAEENCTSNDRPDFYERMQMCRDSESAIREAVAKATGEHQ